MNMLPRILGRHSTPPALPVDPVLAEVLLSLRNHPIAEEAVARHKAATEESRRTIVAEIERCRQEDADARTAMQAEIAEAGRALAEARVALEAAEQREFDARAAATTYSSSRAPRIARLERQLRDTAHPAIGQFIDELWDQGQAERTRAYENLAGKTDTVAEYSRSAFTNVPSLNARAIARRAAIDAARDMELDVVQADVPERIEALRQTIPSIDDVRVKVAMPSFEGPPARDRYGKPQPGLRDHSFRGRG